MEHTLQTKRPRAGILHHLIKYIGAAILAIRYPNLEVRNAKEFPSHGVVAVSPHYGPRWFLEFAYLAAVLRKEENSLNRQIAVVVKPTSHNLLAIFVSLLGDIPLVAATSDRKGFSSTSQRKDFNKNSFYEPGIALADSHHVLIYPQGHRLLEADFFTEKKGLKFHPGAALIAQQAQSPLVSAVVWGSHGRMVIDIQQIPTPEYTGASTSNTAARLNATNQIKSHYLEVMGEFFPQEVSSRIT